MSSSEITITLPDGSTKQVAFGSTIRQVAESIGPSLGKAAIAGVINGGDIVDVQTPLEQDCKIKIVTLKSEEGLEVLRHSVSHVMASAVQKLFPGTQVTFGPAIEDGFFYDFKRDEGFTLEVLAKIDADMNMIIKAND
ncbi:MAG: TGS domain-containing protein [Myxococcota bacterium]